MTSSAGGIDLRGLRRHFPGADRPALQGLDLSIAPGELMVFVGPSGCGKSTALRLIAGLDAPDAGSIHLGGRDVSRVPPQERDVAMVFQGYALYPHMTVAEIMAFPLKMRGVARAARDARVVEVAATLGLSRFLARRPGELSGGERQRVAMGRAIVRAPKVFLFDEPLSNLDAALRAELRVELSALVRRLGTTAIYVTHDQVEAMTLGDRVAVLRTGELLQVGAPRAIYEDPETLFVAGFLGAPAINQVEVRRDDGRYRADGAPISFDVPPGLDLPERAVIAVRPEHVRLLSTPGESTPGASTPGEATDTPHPHSASTSTGASASTSTTDPGPLAATVDARIKVVEPLGAETFVYLESGALQLRARVPGFARLAPGDTVRLGIASSRALWFDATTGKRLRAPG
ncbi:ABC transporter ATP-binding protein [Chondromyces apiculatus]|uniref:Glycerol-3-phosphate ABC transporter, ATP-binding protein UgpC n=1 Tax=Chondromyces apiculatus DSM 436 TaxID=1192034 RepID=A0A017TBJ8_9BACT|nr:ATP-binding cassette domain-containing protein [Chondromyces apiculatus]EYF05986.1 Glycerol-3-phosphate ABC transporter, ATP-binding protein UgpC [Chondromyces apiculatus DSM 436]